MMKRLLFLFILLILATPALAFAQDDEEDEMVFSVWLVTDLDAEEDDVVEDEDALPTEVVVVSLDEDAETILIIWAGIDIVYTRQADGTYSGTELYSSGTYDFTATLTVIDENTMQSDSVTQAGAFTSESSLLYERNEEVETQLFVEGEREIVEFTQFQECLGRTGGTVGDAWTRSDLLVPFRITEDGLIWNQTTFEGAGGVFVNERTEEFGTFENVITQTFTGNEDGFDYSYHAIADGRDDCEMIYNSSYAPFDGDFEAIFALAAELSEVEE